MSDRFPGTMRFADGSTASIELTVDAETLTLSVEGREMGAWPLKYCRVLAFDGAVYTLSIDGEDVEFSPEDPYRFGLTAAQRFEATSLADRIRVIREIPPPSPDGELPPEPRSSRPRLRLGFAIAAIAVAGVVMLGVLTWAAGDSEPPATAVATGPTTTAATIDIFSQPLVVFVDTWNRTVSEFGAPLRIVGATGEAPFEVELADHLLLQTTVDDDGTLQRYVLTADPGGGSDETQLTLAAWGVAIAVADPQLDGAERRQLLADIGIDLDDPELTGLEGEVETDRASYTLSYLHEFRRALFVVAEA